MTSGPQMILRCSKDQADRLREIFKTKPYPSTFEKEALARNLNLPRNFINNWFQRERNQYKKSKKALPEQVTKFEPITLIPIQRPAPMRSPIGGPLLQSTPETDRNPPMKPPRAFVRGTFFPGLMPHQRTIHSKKFPIGPQFAIKQENIESPQLKRQPGFSKLPSIEKKRSFEMPRPSPSAFHKKKMDKQSSDTFLEDHQPPKMPDASPATPGDLMIDENYVPSPLMSSSQNSSTLKSSPVTVKYVRSDKTITNEENEKDKQHDETVLIDTDIDVESSPDSMLPPLREKDITDKDGEGATFDAAEIEEGFAESQMQEIGKTF
ncbi:unnamed protein product [Oikopleura dioica]|uniref:Homeobox domain-containing protein n=1 Tax=Oikopleura dioica TaxID=34765 RepID=E4YAU1_OIKDI|nr:unnamed protein product [Oikopleura dioica]